MASVETTVTATAIVVRTLAIGTILSQSFDLV